MYQVSKNAIVYTFDTKYEIILSQFWRFLGDTPTKCEWKSNYNVFSSKFGRVINDDIICSTGISFKGLVSINEVEESWFISDLVLSTVSKNVVNMAIAQTLMRRRIMLFFT